MSAKKSGASSSEGWLEELESTVRQAGETIASLRREKADLEARIEKLQADAGPESDPGGDEAGDDGAAAWREERQEIRGRVEKLTERLESLLDESDDGE